MTSRFKQWLARQQRAVERVITILAGEFDEKRVAGIREMQRIDPLCTLTWLERRELTNCKTKKRGWMR